MKPTSKMIRVTSRGIVRTSRGRIRTPIVHPYRESIDVIWSMLTMDRATVEEQLADKSFIQLTTENFDIDNNTPIKIENSLLSESEDVPAQEYAEHNPEHLGSMSTCMVGQTSTDGKSRRKKDKRNKKRNNQQFNEQPNYTTPEPEDTPVNPVEEVSPVVEEPTPSEENKVSDDTLTMADEFAPVE